jgi:methanogen homocitrate synthase
MNWKNENWWVSPFNYIEEVKEQLADMPKKVKFHDATLRDGEQTPGVVFTVEEKVEIATMLDNIGVDRIEVALPAVSQQDVDAVKAVVAKKLGAQIFVMSRGMESDIDLAVECGVDGIILELPLGEPRLHYQFAKWDEKQLFDKTLHCLNYAKSKGLEVVLFPMDCTRADPGMFDRFLKTIAGNMIKPDSITLVDTTGCLIPQAAEFMVKKMKEITETIIEVHTHSELGLGVSTSIAAVAAGADVVHTSVAGLGERTGNTPLEQVAVALKTLMGVDMKLDFSKLTELARRVTEIARFKLPLNKPIIGERAFTRESGMGLDLIYNAPLALFCIKPQFVGQEAEYVLGKKSGLASVEMKCSDLELAQLPEDGKKKLLAKIKELSINKKGLVTDEEFIELFKSLNV